MTKKAIALISECLQQAVQAESRFYKGGQAYGVNLVISSFADRLGQEYSKFNRAKFIASTQPPKPSC